MVKQLVAGTSQEKLINQLIERGWPKESARHFVVNIAQTVHQRDDVDEDRENQIDEYRRRIVRDMILGAITFTMMLLSITFSESFSFVGLVFLGMSVYALIDMVIVFIAYSKIRK
jgi:hypothetical protein